MQYTKQSDSGKYILKAYRNEGFFCNYGKYWEFYPAGGHCEEEIVSSRGQN